jgi:hypothetical protein
VTAADAFLSARLRQNRKTQNAMADYLNHPLLTSILISPENHRAEKRS